MPPHNVSSDNANQNIHPWSHEFKNRDQRTGRGGLNAEVANSTAPRTHYVYLAIALSYVQWYSRYKTYNTHVFIVIMKACVCTYSDVRTVLYFQLLFNVNFT